MPGWPNVTFVSWFVLPSMGCAPSGVMPLTEWTSCPLSEAMKWIVSPGLIRTSSGANTKKPVGPRLSSFTWISSAQAGNDTKQVPTRTIALAVFSIELMVLLFRDNRTGRECGNGGEVGRQIARQTLEEGDDIADIRVGQR